MNRPKRVAYTAAAATAVIAGAAGTLSLGPLSTGGAPAAPGSGAEAAALTSSSTADPEALDAAVDQLTREAAALEAEIAAARARLERAGTAAPYATALKGADAAGARGSGPAPAVHTVTGASGSAGGDDGEGEHESGEHEQDEAGDD